MDNNNYNIPFFYDASLFFHLHFPDFLYNPPIALTCFRLSYSLVRAVFRVLTRETISFRQSLLKGFDALSWLERGREIAKDSDISRKNISYLIP